MYQVIRNANNAADSNPIVCLTSCAEILIDFNCDRIAREKRLGSYDHYSHLL